MFDNQAFLNGLLQADGCITFSFEKDLTFKPRIILTQVGEKDKLLKNIQLYLKSHKIRSTLGAANLEIDRQHNIKAFIALIRNVSYAKTNRKGDERPITIPFVGSKLLDLLVLEKVMQLWQQYQKKKDTTLLAQILDLRSKLSLGRTGPKGLTTDELLERFKLKNLVCQNKADAIWKTLTDQAKREGDELLQTVIAVPSIQSDLGFFLSGLLDGDGSIQINFIDPEGRFNIEPLLTLTNEVKANDPLTNAVLFGLLQHALGSKALPYIPNPSGKANRIAINNKQLLLTNKLIPLLETYPPLTEKTVERLRVLKEVLSMPELSSVKSKLQVVDLLEESKSFSNTTRDYEWKQYRNILKKLPYEKRKT